MVKTLGRDVCDTPGTYTFVNPTTTRTWCLVTNNEVVQDVAAGTAWSGTARFTDSTAQPTTVFNLVTTLIPEVTPWRMKTTFTNSLTHVSDTITNTISCRSDYAQSEVSSVTSP